MKLRADFFQLACFLSAVSSNAIHGSVSNYQQYTGSDASNLDFYVHTKEQPLGVGFTFDNKSPYVINGVDTKIITHGYKGNKQQIQSIVNEYLKLDNVNVLTYNWEALAGLSEVTAAVAAVSMGKYLVAAAVNTLVTAYGIKPEQIHLIGYNMGAHLLAAGGREQEKKIGRITGLDPSRKYFDNSSFIQLPGVNKADAKFVDVIHTSGGKLGLGTSVGTADIYPNGGEKQPKCKNDTSGFCDSLLVIDYYAESVKRPRAFWVRKCPNYKDFLGGKCKKNEIAIMGAFEKTTIKGNFYCKTNNKPPYGLEKEGLDLRTTESHSTDDFTKEVPNNGMQNGENAMTQTSISDTIKGAKFTLSPSTEDDLSFYIEYDEITNKTDPISVSAKGVFGQSESSATKIVKPVPATEKGKPLSTHRPKVAFTSFTEDTKEYDLSLDIEYDEIINKIEIGSMTTTAKPNENNTTLGPYHSNDAKPVEIALSFAGKPTGQSETFVTSSDISYDNNAETTTTKTIPYSTLKPLTQNISPDANINRVVKTNMTSSFSTGKSTGHSSQYETQDHQYGVETKESILFSTEKNARESTNIGNTHKGVRTTEPTLFPTEKLMEQSHNLIGAGADSGINIHEVTGSTKPTLMTTNKLMEQSHNLIGANADSGINQHEVTGSTKPTLMTTNKLLEQSHNLIGAGADSGINIQEVTGSTKPTLMTTNKLMEQSHNLIGAGGDSGINIHEVTGSTKPTLMTTNKLLEQNHNLIGANADSGINIQEVTGSTKPTLMTTNKLLEQSHNVIGAGADSGINIHEVTGSTKPTLMTTNKLLEQNHNLIGAGADSGINIHEVTGSTKPTLMTTNKLMEQSHNLIGANADSGINIHESRTITEPTLISIVKPTKQTTNPATADPYHETQTNSPLSKIPPKNPSFDVNSADVFDDTDLALSSFNDGMFYVHTKKHPAGVGIVFYNLSPHVEDGRDTKIITHGYRGTTKDIQPIVDEYLSLGNVNVLSYDWSAAANMAEMLAAANAISLGADTVSIKVVILHLAYKIKLEQIHLIGYGMGAHLMAAVGRQQEGKLGRITGLDPHRKYFDDSTLLKLPGLRKTDAKFVDVVHTSAGRLGLATSVGTADIYPNGGKTQPKCENVTSDSCDSRLVIDYFTESITKPYTFWARKCSNYKSFLDGECKKNEIAVWGAFGNTTINGNFYCSTNSTSPYGSGKNGTVPLPGYVFSEKSPDAGTETTDPIPSFIKNGTFYLHTRDHPEGVKVDFRNIPPYLKKAQDTKILTHDYNKNKEQLQPLVNEFIRKGNMNVMTFDWRATAKLGQLEAALGAVSLGTISVSEEMSTLMTSLKIEPEQIHLIGYGAGAHLMGAAGRKAKEKIGRITGLDPSENYFDNSSQVRFDGLIKTDASFVDVIHTDGKKPGVDANIASIELYPIGVRVGVNCKNSSSCQTPLVKDYLIDSTFKPHAFWFPTCPDFRSFLSGKCNNNTTTGGVDAETTGNSFLKNKQEKMISAIDDVTAPPNKPTQPNPYPIKAFTENGLNFNMEYDDITNKFDLSQQLGMINREVTTRHVPLYTKKFTEGRLNFDMEYDEITRKNPLALDKAPDVEKSTEPVQTWIKRPTKQTNDFKTSGTDRQDVPKTTGQIPSSATKGTFYFHTKKHPEGIEIDFKNFPADLQNGKDTKIITHGYKENKDQLQPIINEFLKKGNVNVITFDWSPAANSDELDAAKNAVFLGTNSVSDKIQELKSLLNIKSDQIHLIGHNMGAHLMGAAGRKIKDQIGVITGLDPHKKYFDNSSDINLPGLSKNDAPLVDVIHTNEKEPGVDNTITSIDLYPTGAKVRPKCKNDHTGSCSVPIVINYFAESILKPDSFWYHECHDFKASFSGKCMHKNGSALESGRVETPHDSEQKPGNDQVQQNVILNGKQDKMFDGDRHNDTTTTKQPLSLTENGTFYFYTNEHPEGIKFDFTNIPRLLRDGTDTKILTHGYKGIKDQLQPIINEYLKKENLNLITFDWSSAANLEELEAAKSALSLGTNTVSGKVQVLISLLKISPEQIHLIGHGMGAHLMGAVGREQKEKLGRITGLDPHKKYFDDSSPIKLPRLRESDAEYVDVFHTSGGTLGIEEKIGTFDFYPNIADIQSKCYKNTSSICNSLLAIEYFAEFVKEHDVFGDTECSDEDEKCGDKSTHFSADKTADEEDHHGTDDEHSGESGASATNSLPNKKLKVKKIKKTQRIKTSEVNGPKFYIHTKDHQEGIEFNFKKPSPYFKRDEEVKIITHGYNGSKDDMQIIVNEYLNKENVNVITLDWRHIANLEELKAAVGAVSIGKNILPAMIRISNLLHGMRPEHTHLIGYNLGAHLMGAAGREQGGTIKRITGLDPAKKFFDNSSHPQLPSLKKTDGKFVDVFHTSAGTLGIDESVGNVDVYPNGGQYQEPCKAHNSSSCNSLISIQYFAESINAPDTFWIINCSTFDDFVHGACLNGSKGTLDDLGRTLTEGNFYFVTNSEPPYGLGLVGLYLAKKLTPNNESVNVTDSKPPDSSTPQSLQKPSKLHSQRFHNFHSPPHHNLKSKPFYHMNPQTFFFRSPHPHY